MGGKGNQTKKRSAGTGKGRGTLAQRESPRIASRKRKPEEEESEYSDQDSDEEPPKSTPRTKRNGQKVSPESQRGESDDDDDGSGDSDSEEEDDDATVDCKEPKKKRQKKDEDSKKKDKDSKKKDKDSDVEPAEVTIARLQKQLEITKKTKRKGLPSASDTKTLTAPQRDVVKKTKTHIFQRAKFIKGPQYMSKATAMAMQMCNPREFEGLGKKELAQKQEEWMAVGGGNENLVRTSINEQRSYCCNEVRDVYTKTVFPRQKDAEFPNVKQILDLAMRNGMEEGAETRPKYIKFMVFYWDVLLVKVSGVAYWPPSARYTLLPSTATSKDRKSKDPESQLMDGDLVHPSAEALLVWCLENAYTRWFHPFMIKRETAAKKLDDAKVLALVEKTKKDLETKFSESKGGQTKFGGVSEKGRERYEELCRMIAKNRKDRKAEIMALEKEVLALVRKKHKREEIEAKQKAKKPNTVPKVAAPIEEDPNFKADDPNQWF